MHYAMHVLSLVALAMLTQGTPHAQRAGVKEMEKKGWVLTFQDEFNDSKLDSSKWIDSYPGNIRTHGDEEKQWYAADGYEVGKGHLRLKGEKREMEGHPYTSGMVASFGKFAQQYGWFEIRAKFPKGKGYWPAFWLLPTSKAWPPEIDVLEILDHEPNKVYLTNHWRDDKGEHKSKGGNWVGPDFTTDYHVFATQWNPGEIIWYVDGIERFRSTIGVPSEPMYLIANLAIGGSWGGYPDASTVFPGYMEIDYIRVYKKQHIQTTTSVRK